MLKPFLITVGDVTYFHPLLVLCIALVASWLPSLVTGCYRLLLPVMKALGALIRKFAIFRW